MKIFFASNSAVALQLRPSGHITRCMRFHSLRSFHPNSAFGGTSPNTGFAKPGNVKRGIYESNIETKRKFLSPKDKRKSGLLKYDKIGYLSF